MGLATNIRAVMAEVDSIHPYSPAILARTLHWPREPGELPNYCRSIACLSW
jgi:hypothetical protein